MRVRAQVCMYACVRGLELSWLNCLRRLPLHPKHLPCILADVVHVLVNVCMYACVLRGRSWNYLGRYVMSQMQTIAMPFG